MKRGIWIGVLAALAFVCILVARLPASWLTGFLPKDITCADIAGTLWNGSCSGLLVEGKPAGDLAWQLHASALLLGKLSSHVDLQHPNGMARGEVDVRPSGDLETRTLVADFTIDPSAMSQVPPDLRGRVHAQLAKLRIEKGVVTAIEGRIDLRDLEKRGSEHSALWDYTLTFPAKRAQSRAGEPVGDLDSVRGPWQVAAVLRLTREPGFEIEGTIAVGPGAPPEIVRSLGYLGPPYAQGRRPFSVAGTL